MELLASEAVSSGIWWWRLALAVLFVMTLASAAGFFALLRNSKPDRDRLDAPLGLQTPGSTSPDNTNPDSKVDFFEDYQSQQQHWH